MSRPAPSETEAVTPASAASDEMSETERARPGHVIGTLALIVGFLWIAAALSGAVVLFGLDRLLRSSPIEIAALAAGVLMPAAMAWFSGAAAREAAQSRAEARRLAEAADRLLNPAQTAELGAKRLANTVRSEIATLERAVETTIARLRDVENLVGQQTVSVEAMSQKAKAGAAQMILGMDRERAELLKISQDLNAQAQSIGDAISRHTRVIAEAARLAEAEVRAADKALEVRISSFGAAASLITDRTLALDGAAKGSADSALRLERALSDALDMLARATDLTDAARQSANEASLAANDTAGALRDTTVRAIEDARRAADLIRSEAGGVERDATIALDRLREAADAARAAAAEARTAAEAAARAPQPQTQRPTASQQDWRREQPPAQDWRDEPRRPAEPPHREPPHREPPPRARSESLFGEPAQDRRPAPAPNPAPNQAGGNWTWRDLLSNVEEPDQHQHQPRERQRSAPRAPADDPVARLAQSVSEPRHAPAAAAPSLPVVAMIEHAGIRLTEVFSASAMDRIVQRARTGTNQRRKAVVDAAPEAVLHLTDFLHQDDRAMHEAMAFLRSDGARIAELLARGRAAMGSDATRAFLLLDAAAG